MYPNFMKKETLCLTVPLILGGTSYSYAQTTSNDRPNVILILVDDMGYSDIGCFGSEISTPNIDGLARQGVCFTDFYNAGRSCPSRASLLTGLYPSQAGVGYMIKDMGTPAYQGYLNKECVTLAEVLHTNGYSTYMSGKWHVGETPQHWPRKRGFDRYFGLISGASHYFYMSPDRQMAFDDTPYLPQGEYYMTDAFTDHAIEFLEGHDSSRPFFLYLAYTAPHWPLQAHPDDIAKYTGKYLKGWDRIRKERLARMQASGILPDVELSPRNEAVPDWDSLSETEKLREDSLMSVYAAMIDRVDQNIGRVLEQLRKMGADKNTMILFLSDNGGCNEGTEGRKKQYHSSGPIGSADSFEAYEDPWANVSNTPFRRFKRHTHEGGISTPLIMWYPQSLPAGTICRYPGHIVDIMPTLAALTGSPYPKNYDGHDIQPMEGENLLPVIKEKRQERPTPIFWEHEGNRALRIGKWKIVSGFANRTFQPWELYDISKDRSEMHDLSTRYPDRLAEMIAQYEQTAKRIGVVPRPELLKNQKKKN